VGPPLDRPGHQLGEEADVEHQVRQIRGSAQTSPVNVDRIAHGLEGIKRDSDRQDNLPGREVQLKTSFARQGDQ